MTELLKTGICNARNVLRYMYGFGVINDLGRILAERRKESSGPVVFFVDHFFEQHNFISQLDAVGQDDLVLFLDTSDEPTTKQVNRFYTQVRNHSVELPIALVGIGGGATMDVTKAISNLLTNGGKAEDYQGWDLVKVPGIYKIGIPTLSGTGAESTRTCVMTNPLNGLKLGMNSDFTVFDQILLDPDLTATVPRNQYFYTGMDAYLHCAESLNGNYRNAIGDAYSMKSIDLCKEVFLDGDMMDREAREKLMVASYLGGCAIATSYVGLVHPFSAGLSVVLGVHHCVGNCIVMGAMEEFYPDNYREFQQMTERQAIEIPSGICKDLTNDQYERLYSATVIHEKPLTNALGENFLKILTPQKVKEIFRRM